MKKAASEKTKQRVAFVLLGVAALAVGWALFSMPGGGGGSAPAATPAQTKSGQKAETLDPRLRLDLLANSEDVRYEGQGKNIFTAAPEPIEQPKVPVLTRQQQAAAEQAQRAAMGPPPPPPINLRYFGLTNTKGEKPMAFLTQGDDVWIAREGDVVNRHYKVVRIQPTSVEIEDLLTNHRESIRLTEGQIS